MKDYLEVSKCLASLAVFRELYDSQKDIYGIIAEFLKEVIASNSKYRFGLMEITQLLNNNFDFRIPEAVVKTSLNRLTFLVKSYGKYTVERPADLQNTTKLTRKHSDIKRNNDLIIEDLFKYIETEKELKLNDTDKKKIVHSFCSFILDESTSQEHSKYISAFIVKNKSNSDFTSKMSIIKEGVVLYSGLKYSANLSELGTWNTDLTIFVETEILFHLAGYNGELYRAFFNDFYSFVKEINQKIQKKDGRKRICLKYYTDVKNEIEKFFNRAEYIIRGQDIVDPSTSAMSAILGGCQTASDVISKKTAFYQLLKSHGIQEDDYEHYYDPKNHKYNIEDKAVIETVSKSLDLEDVTSYLKFLNYINIHRKNTSTYNFENIGFILLTGNSTTLKVALHEAIKPGGSVPLATTLSTLTNKFWFKLNKGFGSNNYPKNFDIITKAQVLLSSLLNESVGKKYDELKAKFKSGELTEKEAVATIVELRKQAKRPEEINENDISDVLISISEGSIENYFQEQELFKGKAQKQEEENKRLKQDLAIKEQELQLKDKENEEKEKELQKYREQEKQKEERALKRNRLIRKSLIVVILLSIVVSGILLYIYHYKVVGMIITALGGVLSILNFFGISFKTFRRTEKK